MSKARKQLITNLYLKPKDIQRLANGYVIYKRANKHAHALIPKQKADEQKKAKELKSKVEYHQAQIEKLIGKLPATGITTLKVRRADRVYTKKQIEHWAKGGNIAKYNASGKSRWKDPANMPEEGGCLPNATTQQ
jgi:hypothetical protein